MSAFCGIYQPNTKPVVRAELATITSHLALWKPDNKFQWIKHNLGVSQWQRYYTPEAIYTKIPTINNYQHYLLASNSRLDNRTELIEKFAITPSAAKTMADEEFLLLAYQQWQEECSNYLVGDFAFVIWDGNKQQLFLSRDQVGQGKMLYYYYKPEELFIFASNIKPVYMHPDVPIELDETELANHQLYGEAYYTNTFYKNIWRLPAGHNLLVTKDSLQLQKYCRSLGAKKIRYAKDCDYIDHFNEIFHKAVKTRLRSYSAMATQLSGGLDSSAVTAVAAKILQEKRQQIWAYGISPPANLELISDKGYITDETAYMEAVANYYPNINFTKIVENSSNILQTLERYNSYAERPPAIPFNRFAFEKIYTLCSERGIRNMLDGAFGNFSISWRGVGSWWQVTKYLIRRYQSRAAYLTTLFFGYPDWNCGGLLNPAFVKQQKMFWRYWKLQRESPAKLDYSLPILSTDYAYINTTNEAIFGIETRDPTSDLAILNFCSSIPNTQYCAASHKRLLIRHAMEGILPEIVRTRTTRGLQSADWYYKFSEGYQVLAQLVNNMLESPLSNKYFATEKIVELLRQWPVQTMDKQTYASLYKYQIVLYCLLNDVFVHDILEKGKNG